MKLTLDRTWQKFILRKQSIEYHQHHDLSRNMSTVIEYTVLIKILVVKKMTNIALLTYGGYLLNRCRNRDFASIIPHQPARYRERHNEVFLDFEAFLLASMKERSTLWIHSQIKACMDAGDCQPDYCLDLFEPSGQ